MYVIKKQITLNEMRGVEFLIRDLRVGDFLRTIVKLCFIQYSPTTVK